jgi:sugar phosphate permease
MLLAGGGGMIFAGWLADHQLKRDRVDAPIRLSLIAALAAIPIGGGLAFAASPVAAMTLVGITTFLVSVPIALAPVAFQNVTPNRLRGQATALYLLMVNLIGMGCGPTLVALVTDVGFRDESKVLLSVSIVGASSMVLAAALIGLAVRPYRSLHRARAEAMKIVRYPLAE